MVQDFIFRWCPGPFPLCNPNICRQAGASLLGRAPWGSSTANWMDLPPPRSWWARGGEGSPCPRRPQRPRNARWFMATRRGRMLTLPPIRRLHLLPPAHRLGALAVPPTLTFLNFLSTLSLVAPVLPSQLPPAAAAAATESQVCPSPATALPRTQAPSPFPICSVVEKPAFPTYGRNGDGSGGSRRPSCLALERVILLTSPTPHLPSPPSAG